MEKRHYSSAEQLSSSSVFSDTIIMSRNNPKVKQICALLKRPERERTGLALVEGLRLVTEALRYPQRVRQLIVAPELLRSQHGQALWKIRGKKGSPTPSFLYLIPNGLGVPEEPSFGSWGGRYEKASAYFGKQSPYGYTRYGPWRGRRDVHDQPGDCLALA